MRESFKNIFLIFIPLIALLGNVYGLKAEASISAQEVEVGESFRIVIQVSDDKEPKKLPWPKLAGNLSAFKVDKNKGTSTSSQMTIVNGKMTRSKNYVTDFTFTLTAKKAGQYTFGPITFKHGSLDKNFGMAKVKVNKQIPGLKLISSVNKREVYVGEQVRFKLRIIPKNTVQNIQPPNFTKEIGKNFWTKAMDREIKPKVIKIQGVDTRVFDLNFALFPLVADSITFPSIPINYEEMVGRNRSRGLFGMFDGKTVTKEAYTNPVRLTVQSLPKGAPAGFSGAVGSFSLSAKADKTELATGEALTISIVLSGNGQPKSLRSPTLPNLTHFEIFDPEVKSSQSVSGNIIRTTKRWKYVLIPNKKGNQTIQPIQFVYFDPDKEIYITLNSNAISILVTQGDEIESTQARFLTQKDIEEIGSDIRHIKKINGILKNKKHSVYKNPLYWLMYLILPLLAMGLYIYLSRQERLGQDLGLRRKTHAKGIVKKRLSEARKSLDQNDSRVFYKNLAYAVERFTSDKLNLEFRGLVLNEAVEKLGSKKVPENIKADYRSLMEQCDMGQFASSDNNKDDWNRDYEKAANLIIGLDRAL